MIVDASAIVAIVRDEPDAARLYSMMRAQVRSSVSAANFVEAAIVIDADDDRAQSRRLDELLRTLDIEIVPVTTRQAHIAREAYRVYGKGSGHRARLNFGDCFAYALAIDTGEPLLFVGKDFTHTDVRSAIDGS